MKTELPYDPIIPLLNTYPQDPKIFIPIDICTSLFTEALSMIVKIWNQVRYALLDKQVIKMWYIVENYTTVRKDRIL